MSSAASRIQRRRRRRRRGTGEGDGAVAEGDGDRANSVLQKLQASIEGGDFYSALQVYKALFLRYVAREKRAAAIDLATRGSRLLLEKGFSKEGTDLALELVDVLAQSDISADEETLAKLREICTAYPKASKEAEEDKQRFLTKAVEWSAKSGEYQRGDPKLNQHLALSYVRLGKLQLAISSFLFTMAPKEFAMVMHKWSTLGYKSERDLLLARGVLQLLAVENLRDARIFNDCFVELVTKSGKVAEGDVETPMVHFCDMLIETCLYEEKAVKMFNLLRERYKTCLALDQSFQPLMDLIAQKYFGVQPPKPAGLAGLMRNMFGGM